MKTAIRNRRTLALIQLLDDPEKSVHEIVERELLKEDFRIIPALENIWEASDDEHCQIRVENLIQRLQFQENNKKFRTWAKQPELDLLEGYILASRYHYPDLNADKIHRRIEEIRKKVWVEINNSLTSLEKITVLNHIFFNDYNFGVDHENSFLPKNCFINYVLESGRGNAVSIAMLYTIIAHKLGLPVEYIDVPRSPLLAYVDKRIAARVHPRGVETDVLFYINPVNNGSITGRRELEFHLKKLNIEPVKRYFEPETTKCFLVRLLEMTEKSYEMSGNVDKTSDILLMINILNPRV